MADVFRKQNLYKEAVFAEKQYSTFAFKANDFLNFIRGKERLIPIYYSLRDTTKAIAMTKLCADLYNKYNYPKFAAGVYPILISYYISKGNYKMAGCYVNIFEKKSGAFDAKGNIAPHREHYYYLKGRYCLGIKQIDSANFYFRKVGCYGYRYESAKGLQALYELLQQRDSVLKYSRLCQKEMDEILLKQQTNAVKQAASMYNYNRIQATADKMLLEKVRTEKEVIALLLSVFALCLLIAYLYKRYKKNMSLKQLEMDQRAKEYQDNMEIFQVSRLKEAKELKDKMEKLQAQLQNYKMQYDKIMLSEKNVVVEDDEIYLDFKKMAKGLRSVPMPSAKEWKMLEIFVAEKFPVFYGKICNKEEGKKLSLQEWRVCLLTRLHFSNSEIVNILDSSPSSVSNAKQKVNEKLFGGTSASTLLKNMLKM